MIDQPEEDVKTEKYQWSKMTDLKFGRYAEHLVCMELLAWDFNIYTVDVDDHGIDLIGRRPGGTFYEFQIKASRKFNYIFFPKSSFQPNDTLFGVIVPFIEGEAPQIYLIPSTAWLHPTDQLKVLLKEYNYEKEGQTSKPEWGVAFNEGKNLPLLAPYKFDEVIQQLL